MKAIPNFTLPELFPYTNLYKLQKVKNSAARLIERK